MIELIEDLSPMQAGRELDALVAERVMGKPPEYYHCPHFDKNRRMLAFCNCPSMPRYSTSFGAMWKLIKFLSSRVDFFSLSRDCGYWFCVIENYGVDIDNIYFEIGKQTAMEAVCFAALAHVGYSFERKE